MISVLLSLPKKPGLACPVTQSCPALCDPVDCNPQAALFMGFCRQEHWSGMPFPSPGIRSTSPVSPALAGGSFTTAPPGKPKGLPL